MMLKDLQLNRQNPKKVIVRRMTITSYDSKTGIVTLQAIDDDGSGYAEAQFLSKVPLAPDQSGGGEYIYPRIGAHVLVQTVGTQHFILGFYQPGIYGSSGKKYGPSVSDTDIAQASGGYKIETGSGSHISLLLTGLIRIFTDPWASISLDQLAKRLWADIKNLFVHTGGGRLRWTTDENNKSEFLLEVRKQFEATSDSDVEFGTQLTRNESYPEYSDKFIMRSRSTDSHMMEMETRQAIDSDVPNTQVLTKYGRDATGNHIHVYVQDKDNRQATDNTLGTDYLHKRLFTTNDGIEVDETINNDGSLVITVNDKATITIAANGQITIRSNDEQVYIGAESAHQGVVLEQFIQDYLLHVHQGNLGTTTSTPMRPFGVFETDPSTDTPSTSNWHSARTKVN